MDPVTQTFAQQDSGSAQGQGFGQFFVAGRQDARQRQQLNLAARAEARLQQRQTTMLPQEQALLGIQIANAGVVYEANRMEQANKLAANAKLPELIDIQRRMAMSQQGHADGELMDAALTIFRQVPMLTETAVGKEILSGMAAAPKLTRGVEALNRANQMMSPEDRQRGLYVQRFDERGGPVLGELPAATLLTPEERAARAKAAGLEPSGMDTKGQVDYARPVSGSTQKVYDAQGNVIYESTSGKQSATPGGLTTSNLTDVNKKVISTDIALHELDRLEDAVDKLPGGFGALGKGRELLETGKGMLGSTEPTPISNVRNQAQVTFTQIADSLRVDTGNMSLYERRQLEKAGDITGIDVSAPQARGKIRNVRNALIGAQLRRLQAAGRKPTDEHLRQVSPSEFDDIFESGLLTPEDAKRWFKLHAASANLPNR